MEILNPDADSIKSTPEILTKSLGVRDAHSTHEGKPEMGTNGIIGDSPALESVLAEVKRVTTTESTVLILGETGNGVLPNPLPRSDENLVALPLLATSKEIPGKQNAVWDRFSDST